MRRPTQVLAVAAVALAVAPAGAAPLGARNFGARVAALGDLNGDGVPDFAAASGVAPKLAVCSGKNWSILWTADAFDATAVPDQNEDGKPDVALAMAEGWVTIADGATGSKIREVKPERAPQPRGARPPDTLGISSVGDVDGDGRADLLLVRAAASGGTMEAEYGAYVISIDGKFVADLEADRHGAGKWTALPWCDADGDGRTDFLVAQTPDQSHLGMKIVSARKGLVSEVKGSLVSSPDIVAVFVDTDGDHRPELLFGSTLAKSGEKKYAGEVRIASGKDPKTTLRVVKGEKEGDGLGRAMSAAGDLDGDGVVDFVAGAPSAAAPKEAFGAGAVRAFSGKTGKAIWSSYGEGAFGEFGGAVASIGDVNGDGVADVVAGAPAGAYVRVLSGKDGATLGTVREADVK